MRRSPELETAVLETIVNVAMRDVRLLQREYTFWQSKGVNIIRVVVAYGPCCIPREQSANRQQYCQRQQLQPKANLSLPLLFGRVPDQLVGQDAEKFRHDLQEVVAAIGSTALREVRTGNLPVSQGRREAFPFATDVRLTVHDHRDYVIRPAGLYESRHFVVNPVLPLDVRLCGVWRADDDQVLRCVQLLLYLLAQITKGEIDGIAENGPYLDVLADFLPRDRRQTIMLQLTLQPLRLSLVLVVVAYESVVAVFLV